MRFIFVSVSNRLRVVVQTSCTVACWYLVWTALITSAHEPGQVGGDQFGVTEVKVQARTGHEVTEVEQ